MRNRVLEWALWAAVLATAAVLRFRGLGSTSLWGDEIRLVSLARRPVAEVWQHTVFPPVHLLVLKAASIFGTSEVAVRFPSALAGVLGVAALMLLAAHLWGRAASLPAGLLIALNPFHLTASREAKYFPLVVLLASVAALGLWKARSRTRWLWLFAAASLINMYTHTYAALLVACQLPFAVWVGVKHKHHRRATLSPVALLIVGSLPLLWKALGSETLGAQSAIGDTPFAPLSVAYYLRLLATFGPGPRVWPAAAALLLGLFVLGRDRVVGALVLVSIAVPILMVAALRPPIYVDRYLAPSAPFLLLWLTAGIHTLTRPVRRFGSGAGVVASTCLALALLPACAGIGVAPIKVGSSHEDWRGVASFLRERTGPGDIVVVAQERRGWKPLLQYYLGDAGGARVLSAQDVPRAVGEADTVGYRWWVMRCADKLAFRMKPTLEGDFVMHTFPGFVVVGRGDPCTATEVYAQTAWVMQARLLLPMVHWVKPRHFAVLGDLHLASGDTARARSFHRRALSLEPKLPQALAGLKRAG